VADGYVANFQEVLESLPLILVTSNWVKEVMQALSLIDKDAPDWKYVCKVWPQPRNTRQNMEDMQLASDLGIEKNVVFATNVVS
jgi:alpha-maltose-1-phosphate synthase